MKRSCVPLAAAIVVCFSVAGCERDQRGPQPPRPTTSTHFSTTQMEAPARPVSTYRHWI